MKGVETTGTVIAVHRNRYDVRLDVGPIVSATESGRLRKARVWLTLGDAVQLQLCMYDPTQGRITRRL